MIDGITKPPKGTPVRCLVDSDGSFTKGTIYVVGGPYYDTEGPRSVCVERDDNDRPNGWFFKNFELAGGPW